MPDSLPEPVRDLLANVIETTERLDVLLLLYRAHPKGFAASAVAKHLHLLPANAETALAMLCGRGLLTVTIANDLVYAYAPVTPELGQAVDAIAALDVADDTRGQVRGVLRGGHARDPARAFAAAFLFGGSKKGNDDG